MLNCNLINVNMEYIYINGCARKLSTHTHTFIVDECYTCSNECVLCTIYFTQCVLYMWAREQTNE